MTAPFGWYVHVPFCGRRCDYCAFATWTDRHHLIDDYLDAMRVDIDRAVASGAPAADTIFVGGGTPTLVPADGLAAVLAAIPDDYDGDFMIEVDVPSVDSRFESHRISYAWADRHLATAD